MKKYTFLILLLCGCSSKNTIGIYNDGVDQSLEKDCMELTSTKGCVMTSLWIDKNIVYSSYLPVTSSKEMIKRDSLKADSIFTNIKSL